MVEMILIAVIIGAVSSLLIAIRTGERDLEVISKTAASASFVVLGLSRWNAGDTVATWIIVGLVLCAVGDFFLLWGRTFLLGLATFLIGHLAYIVAFVSALPISQWSVLPLGPVVLSSLGAVVWLWPHLGRRRLPVVAYIVVISLMVWGALAVTMAGAMAWSVTVGATLFYLSDLAVARQRFVEKDFLNRALGLPLYYAGQILIAMSVGMRG
jgi:uncharacterized membrane protein YhhN